MKAFVEKHKLIIGLVIIFVLAEIIVNPIADIPLNDDWVYAQSVVKTLETGNVDISPLSSASIFTHIVWGSIFVKIFGFSFTVLRFSTLISALIAIIFLNKLIIRITESKLAGVLAAAILLFNPIYFNTANSYMTDVNFITLLIISVYFAFDFYHSHKMLSFIMVFIFSLLAILLRQYGVIIPFCFAISCLFNSHKRWLYFGASIILFALTLYIFNIFEKHLQEILPANAGYQFSGKRSLSDPETISKFIYNIKDRYKVLLIHVLVYGFPFCAVFLIDLIREFRFYLNLIILLFAFVVTYLLFSDLGLPMGNVFGNRFLGAETFFQTFEGGFHYEMQHYSKTFEIQVSVAKYIFSTGSITAFIICLLRLIKRKGSFFPSVQFVFTVGLLLGYAFIVLLTEGFFDRYQLPLILLGMIFFAVCVGRTGANQKIALIPIGIFFYISVFGTKDYIEMNRKRWEAYYFVKDRLGCPSHKINGGYEITGWTSGDPLNQWYYFMGADTHWYLIQYKSAEKYRKVREYEFQRYFPYKKDKISIFMNLRKRQ